MTENFRVKIKDKLLHVVGEIQKGLEGMDSSSPVAIPNHIALIPVSLVDIKALGFVSSEVHTKDIVSCQLRVRLVNNNLVLYGASFKNWEKPDHTDGAKWRIFGLPMVAITNGKPNIPPRYNKIQHVALNNNYIQREISSCWCDYITRFPQGCNELKDIGVPGWMKEEEFRLLIKRTIQYN